MPEVIQLDPPEVSTGRTALDITAYVKAEGADWGDAEIAQYLADRERGSAAVDFRIPNRRIVLPLNVKTVGAVTFAQARQNLQAKVARIQQEGGWIKRTTNSGTLFADVTNATLKFGGDWMQGRTNSPVDTNAVLTLEAIPDWYGPEVTLADHVETSNSELVFTETGIAGNYPGRLRLVVDNDQAGAPQMGLLWGIRCRHYSNSTTALLKYEAETCTPLDAAGSAGGVVSHSSLSSSWTPILSTNQTGGVSLTHTGTYRVWVRAASVLSVATAPLPFLRLVWDVGDFALPTENAPVQFPIRATPGGGQFCLLDLGEVRLDRVPAGTHRWQGIIQGRGAAGGENAQIDKIWFVPVDEGYGVLRAPALIDVGLAGYTARDEFNQTAGVLAGKALAAGGAWSGAGDTDDFVVDATNHWAQRTAVSDATPRFELAGTTVLSNTAVSVSVQHSVAGGLSGVLARWVDINNHLQARLLSLQSTTTQTIIQVAKIVGGSTTVLLDELVSGTLVNVPAGVLLTVDTVGRWAAYTSMVGGTWTVAGRGVDSALATGGVLDDGRVGMFDQWSILPPSTRYFEAFAAWVPSTDAVLHPGQSAELRTEGMFREEATGTAFGPVSHVVGDLPRIPPSGSEGRTVQFLLKPSRGNFDTLADTDVADDISARVTYRPSFLFVQ